MIETSKEVEMNAVQVASLAVAAPLFALGLSDLQSFLERWDQERHAQD
jgi:hypothetical protein